MKTSMNNSISAVYKHTLRALRAGSLLLAVLASGEASAQTVPNSDGGVWTQVASACTPDESSLSYQLGNAALESTTGEVTVRCNVTDLRNVESLQAFGGDWNTLELTYRDPDGTATGNRVMVELHRTSNVEELVPTSVNGRIVNLIQSDFTLASIDSNSSASTGRTTLSRPFSHSFDFVNNAYYVVIKVKRPSTGSTVNPAAFIIRLYHRFFIGG